MTSATTIAKTAAKILAYTVGGIVAFVLLVVVALNFLLQSESFTGFVLDKVGATLEDKLGADLEVESFSLQLFPAIRIRLRNAVFTPAEGTWDREFAKLGNLELDAEFAPLLTGHVVVDRILIEDVSNYLFIDENGLANLPIKSNKPKEEKPPSGPPNLKLPIEVKDLQLKGAQFYLDLDKKPEEAGPEMQIAVKSIGLSARTDMSTGDTSAELRVADGDFKMGKMHDTVERIDIDATANLIDWVATVTKAEARAPGLSLDLTASATDLVGDIVVLADLDGKVQLSKVNDLITPEPTLGGEVSIQAHAELPLPEYKVDAKVTMPSGRVNQMHVGDLRIAANLDSEKVAVTDLFLRAGGGTLSAKADLGLKNDMPLAADVKIDKIDVRRALEEYGLREAGVGTFVTGTVHADGRLGNKESGTPMRIASAVDLEASNFHFQDVVKIPSITLDAKSVYQPTGVDVENLQVQTAKTTIKVDGRVKLPEVGLGLNVFVDSPDLSEFSPIGGKEVGGAIHIEAKSGGTAKEPSTDAAIQAEDLHYADFGVDEIKGVVAMAGKKIDVSSLTIRAQETVINADAKVNLAQSPPRIDARLKTDKADIADLTAAAGQKELALAGVVDLNVDVEGPADRLTGTAFVHGEKIKAFGENVETLHLDTKLADGQVNVDQLKIVKLAPPRPDFSQRADKVLNTPKSEWKQVTIQGKGSIDPNSGKIDFVLNADNLNEQTSDNLRERNIPLLADVDLDLDAGGTIDDPQAKLLLAIRQARYGEMVLGNSNLEVNVADHKAHVTGTLLADRQKVAQDVPVPVTDRDWVIRRFDSKAKPQASDQDGAPESASAEATAPSPEDFTADPMAADQAGDDDPFAKALQDDKALLAEQPLGRVSVDITASLTDDQELSGEVAFEQFDFSDFLAPLKSDKPVAKKNAKGDTEVEEGEDLVEGYLDGRVAIDGSLKDAANARVALDFNKLFVRKNEVWLRNESPDGGDQPLRLTYQGGDLSVESFYLGGTGLTAKMEEQGDQLVLMVEAGLVVAQEFVPMLADADGKVVVEARVPRHIDPQAARATVRLENGELGLQGVPTPVEDLNLVVSFADGKLEVDRLDANIGGGTLNGGGEVTLAKDDKDYTHLDLFVKLRDVDTGMDPYLAVSVKKVDLFVGNIRRGANRGKIDLSGEVVLDKAYYFKSIDFNTILSYFSNVGRQKQSSGSQVYEKEAEESVFFNIAVRADDNVGVRSNLAEIDTSVDLILVGSNIAPGLKGSVDVIDGWATVLQNRYEITQATVQFYDEQRIFPSFDINAETEVKGTKIYVNVSGNPLNYRLSFRSDPPMSERDIFFLLATGVNYDEFMAGGSGVSGDEAAGIAAQQLVGSQISKLTGDTTGFEVGFDSSSGNTRLKVSGELEKDLYLTMYRGLVDEELGAELEYDFYRYVAGIGTWNNLAGYDDAPEVGAFGAGLRVKIDFQ